MGNWIRIRSEVDLTKLEKMLTPLLYNSWTDAHRDKNGNPISLIGYDRKPDSDWGKIDNKLNAWFSNDALYERGVALIKKNAKD